MEQKIKLNPINFGTIPNPPSGEIVIGVDQSDGKIKYKDSSGVLHEVGGSDTFIPTTITASTNISWPVTDFGVACAYSDNKLYVTSDTNRIGIIDISDRDNPYVSEYIPNPPGFNSAYYSAVTNGRLLIAVNSSGQTGIWDISEKTPEFLSAVPQSANCLALNKNLLVASGYGFQIKFYDLTDPRNPVLLHDAGGVISSCEACHIENNLCAVTGYQGVAIFDVSACYGETPSAPTLLLNFFPSGYSALNSGGDVKIYRNHLYVSDFRNYIWIFDLANPASPVEKARLSGMSGACEWGINIQGDYAYFTDRSVRRLNIYNIKNPASPIRHLTYNLSVRPARLTVVGKNIYFNSFRGDVITHLKINGVDAHIINAGTINVGSIFGEEADFNRIKVKQEISAGYVSSEIIVTDKFVSPEYSLIKKALAGDMVLVIDPATTDTTSTSSSWSRDVEIRLETSTGEVHSWFNEVSSSVLSVSDTSAAGTASITSSDLTFVRGVAIVEVSGDANNWLSTETDTLSVGDGVELEVLGYQLLNGLSPLTSVETFTDPPALTITLDNIANSPISPPTNLAGWNNTFFQVGTYADSPFTSVDVVGNQVILKGATNLRLRQYLFFNKSWLISLVDTGGIVTGMTGDNHFDSSVNLTTVLLPSCNNSSFECFSNCTGLVTVDLSGAETIGNETFTGCTALTSIDLSSCTALGNNVGDNWVFLNMTGLTGTLTCPTALSTCSGGSPDGDIQYLTTNNPAYTINYI